MALARKGSRPITVDGRSYRWRVNDEDLGLGFFSVTVSLDEASGQTMCFRTGGEPRWVAPGYPHPAVKPAKVGEAIRQAASHGWRADEPGKPFDLWRHLPEDW